MRKYAFYDNNTWPLRLLKETTISNASCIPVGPEVRIQIPNQKPTRKQGVTAVNTKNSCSRNIREIVFFKAIFMPFHSALSDASEFSTVLILWPFSFSCWGGDSSFKRLREESGNLHFAIACFPLLKQLSSPFLIISSLISSRLFEICEFFFFQLFQTSSSDHYFNSQQVMLAKSWNYRFF